MPQDIEELKKGIRKFIAMFDDVVDEKEVEKLAERMQKLNIPVRFVLPRDQ